MSLFSTRKHQEDAYADFVVSRQTHLRRIAYAICGDWHQADDLLQEALIKLYVAWPRVRRDGHPEAYVRKILVRANIDEHRRRGRRPATTALTDRDDRADLAPLPPEEHSALFDALQQMPEMQRRVVVLRHWLGLDVRETAAELGVTEGTVKSHASRGLERLRALLAVVEGE